MHALQTRTLSPRELANVVGVSESSIKRWVDDGLIPVTRTAGGHRRIVLPEALRFVREQQMRILRPDLLGLPDLADLPEEARTDDLTGRMLIHLLEAKHLARARGLIVAAFLDGMPIASLFDGPVAEVLDHFGGRWRHAEEGIYLEHVATSVCLEAVNQIRLLMPSPPPEAPCALGGAPENDPYLLPSLMAATVAAGHALQTVNLGPHTPVATFLHAVQQHRPALVWLAVTAELEPGVRQAVEQELWPVLEARRIRLILGGRTAQRYWGAQAPYPVLNSMTAFDEILRAL